MSVILPMMTLFLLGTNAPKMGINLTTRPASSARPNLLATILEPSLRVPSPGR
jgi:hypothetical protein